MPSKKLKYTSDIDRLRKDGLSDSQIAERLSIGKSIVNRNLHEARTKERLAKLMHQAGLLSLKQALATCEVGWRWVEGERLKLLEGKSHPIYQNITAPIITRLDGCTLHNLHECANG